MRMFHARSFPLKKPSSSMNLKPGCNLSAGYVVECEERCFVTINYVQDGKPEAMPLAAVAATEPVRAIHLIIRGGRRQSVPLDRA